MEGSRRFSTMPLIQGSLFLLLLIILFLFDNGGSFWPGALFFIILCGWHFYSASRITDPRQHQNIRYLYIGIYLLCCTLLVWLTRGEEESPLWIVYFLPIILSASVLPLRHTLVVCSVALVLFISHLPAALFVNENLRSEVLPELLGFGIMFFLVGTLVQDFAQRHRQHLLQLEQTEKQLRSKERLASLGELSAGIAHEIRNPLGIISSSAQMLEAGNISEPDRQLLDIIQEEASRLNSLIRDFLFFGRQLEPHIESCNLAELLKRQTEALQVTAQQRRVALTLTVKSPDCQADIDAGMIQQVVLNLLLNALDATAEHGHVNVTLDQQQHNIVISVSDDGAGIAAEHMERIFDPFFTTKGHGTGLGLANSYKIIQSHGGEILATSQPEGGTRMTIVLPARGK